LNQERFRDGLSSAFKASVEGADLFDNSFWTPAPQMIGEEFKFEVTAIAFDSQRTEHLTYVEQAVGWLFPLKVRRVSQDDDIAKLHKSDLVAGTRSQALKIGIPPRVIKVKGKGDPGQRPDQCEGLMQ
jgi:hypothetical protein